MEIRSYESHPHPLLSQTHQNTTLWIGHLQTDPTDHFAGQTFTCPTGGQLDNIQVYTAAVNQPGELGLTLHEFDPVSRTWGPAIAEARRPIEFGDEACWTRFSLQPVELKRETTYGFRLSTPDAMVGLGEAVTGQNNPFTNGLEWHGDSNDREGQYYSYFSLAFKVECA